MMLLIIKIIGATTFNYTLLHHFRTKKQFSICVSQICIHFIFLKIYMHLISSEILKPFGIKYFYQSLIMAVYDYNFYFLIKHELFSKSLHVSKMENELKRIKCIYCHLQSICIWNSVAWEKWIFKMTFRNSKKYNIIFL